MTNKKYNPFVDTYNFNANSSNWVQRLGHNADFYNNPLGYNSSPTPRPYDNTAKLNNNVPKYWDSANEGRKVLDYVIQKEGNITPESQDFFAYGKSGLTGGLNTIQNYMSLRDKRYTDKYKHALINCKAAQSGKGGYDIVKFISDLKEKSDVKNGSNTIDSSLSDNYANEIGRLLGTKYRKGDCGALIRQYINKNW